MNGHKFVQRQFYQIILCAFCNEFLLNAAGYQCEDCRYTCHRKCYQNVVTKCISKSNTGVSGIRRFPSGVHLTRVLVYRKMTQTRSTTVSPTASNLLTTLAQTGAATAATCFPSAARTHDGAQNATSPATPTAPISSPTSAVCPWRPPICSSRRLGKCHGARRSRNGVRQLSLHPVRPRSSNTSLPLQRCSLQRIKWPT